MAARPSTSAVWSGRLEFLVDLVVEHLGDVLADGHDKTPFDGNALSYTRHTRVQTWENGAIGIVDKGFAYECPYFPI